MSTISLAEGAVFADRYRIIQCIASGGMGAVYEVVHLETERRRALKVMHPHFLQSQELRDRFRQEARVAAQIDSEFIVDVFDAGVDAATQMPFLVMELLRGEEVGKLLRKSGRFSPIEAVTYLYQTALALDKTHRAMIVHRDLKPANLFLTHRENGAPQIKVLDFGIAKVVAESGTNVKATQSLGTPLYMAPEQFRQGQKLSPATDLYALGMMAYTLLVGKAYWDEEARCNNNVFAFACAVMNGPQEYATARALRAGVTLPPMFDGWFGKAAAPNPDHRFRSATVLVAGLAETLGVPAPGVETYGVFSSGMLSSAAPASGVLSSEMSNPRPLPSQTEVIGGAWTPPPPGPPPNLRTTPNLTINSTTTTTSLGMSRTAPPPKGKPIALRIVFGSAVGVVAIGAILFIIAQRRAPVAAAAPTATPTRVAQAIDASVFKAALAPMGITIPKAPNEPSMVSDPGAARDAAADDMHGEPASPQPAPTVAPKPPRAPATPKLSLHIRD